MKLVAFKKRTSQLQLPKDIYDFCEKVAKECETCSKLTGAPPRSKVSGMRAEVFGDLIFVDYGAVKNAAASARTRSSKSASFRAPESEIREPSYDFMIILDGATNFIYAIPLDDLSDASGQACTKRFHASHASQTEKNCRQLCFHGTILGAFLHNTQHQAHHHGTIYTMAK